ncbi:hypothetical protein MHB40_18005 [Lysinibacillus sp. FSL K6-0057]|uniref:hypothetical protein n=1 Tax=Lysinibacillus sp. FSL K6-0057 TaxID=2921411 RepID=UPI00315A9BB5
MLKKKQLKKQFNNAIKNANPTTLSILNKKKWSYKKSLKNAIWNKDYLTIFLLTGSITERIVNRKIDYTKHEENIPFSFRLSALSNSKGYFTEFECKRFSVIYRDLRNPAAHGDEPPAPYTTNDINLCLKVVYTLLKTDITHVVSGVKAEALTKWRFEEQRQKRNRIAI